MSGVRPNAVVRDAKGKNVKNKDGSIEKPDWQPTLFEFVARPKSPGPIGPASGPPGASHASPAAPAASGSKPMTSPPSPPLEFLRQPYHPCLVQAAAQGLDTEQEREGKGGSEPCAPSVISPHDVRGAELIETLRLALRAAEVASVPDISFFGDDDDVPEAVLLQLFQDEADLLFSWLVLGGCGEEGATAEAEERYANRVGDMREDFWAALERLDETAIANVAEAEFARMSLAATPVRPRSLASHLCWAPQGTLE